MTRSLPSTYTTSAFRTFVSKEEGPCWTVLVLMSWLQVSTATAAHTKPYAPTRQTKLRSALTLLIVPPNELTRCDASQLHAPLGRLQPQRLRRLAPGCTPDEEKRVARQQCQRRLWPGIQHRNGLRSEDAVLGRLWPSCCDLVFAWFQSSRLCVVGGVSQQPAYELALVGEIQSRD